MANAATVSLRGAGFLNGGPHFSLGASTRRAEAYLPPPAAPGLTLLAGTGLEVPLGQEGRNGGRAVRAVELLI